MTTMARIFDVGAVLAAVFFAAAPARADVVKLAELERRALDRRATLGAEQARILEANARLALSRAGRHPSVGAVVGVEAAPGGKMIRVRDTSGDEYFVEGSRDFGSDGVFVPAVRYNATVSLSARLYDFGRSAANTGAAEANVGAAQATARARKLAIVLDVRAAYLAWLRAHGARAILRESAAEASALRKLLEGRVAEGTRPAAAVAQARYDEARAALDLSGSEGELDRARLALEQAVAQELEPDAEPDYSVLAAPPADSSTPALPQIRALERQRDAALATARAAGKSSAPVIAGGADVGLAGQGSHLFPVYRVGVSISVPILDGGSAAASAAIARAQAEELAALARDARTRDALSRKGARADLHRAEERLRLAEVFAAESARARAAVEEERELGAATPEAVIDARIRDAQARLELLSAKVSRAAAALGLASPP